jgi:hypothetical protein
MGSGARPRESLKACLPHRPTSTSGGCLSSFAASRDSRRVGRHFIRSPAYRRPGRRRRRSISSSPALAWASTSPQNASASANPFSPFSRRNHPPRLGDRGGIGRRRAAALEPPHRGRRPREKRVGRRARHQLSFSRTPRRGRQSVGAAFGRLGVSRWLAARAVSGSRFSTIGWSRRVAAATNPRPNAPFRRTRRSTARKPERLR